MRLIDRVVQIERDAGAPIKMLQSLPFNAAVFAGSAMPFNTPLQLLKQVATGIAGVPSGGHLLTQVSAGITSVVSPMPTVNSTEAWAFKHTMLAAQTFMLAAASHGLSTIPMEGLDDCRVRQALDIPSRYTVPVVIAVG